MSNEVTMEKIVALAKGRGFVYPGSEIYGGLANTWDYGPLGVEFKNNIKKAWWKKFVQENKYNVGLDAAILMNPRTWEASGHVGGFSDPLIDCKNCHSRFRADKLIEDHMMANGQEQPVIDGWPNEETAQGIFVNFKNVARTSRKKIPFGICQIGKSFRNEITPGNFTFRTREFEQMECEFFCKPGTDLEWFAYWKDYCENFLKSLNMNMENVRLRDHEKEELSHYSNATTDIEYRFPFGWGELWGIADRTDFDLSRHSEYSGEQLTFTEGEGKDRETYIPYCIEPSLGADRVALAFLIDAYEEETVTDAKGKEDTRVIMHFHPALAPYKAAVLPLAKKLADQAEPIYEELSRYFNVDYDVTGSIGKRYRREDEIGTPYCICVDFDTETDRCVTIRDRDTMEQIRIPIEDVKGYIEERLQF